MRFLITGHDRQSGQPVGNLIVESENPDAARAQATEQGTVVERVEVIGPAAPPSPLPAARDHQLTRYLIQALRILAAAVVVWGIYHVDHAYDAARVVYDQVKAFEKEHPPGTQSYEAGNKALRLAAGAATDGVWTAIMHSLSLVAVLLGLSEMLRLGVRTEQYTRGNPTPPG
jgi:hypothetical protein